ncbi:hypothetical protein BOVA514_2931 [Bacteroides ovatus]|nr:hypothetical protein BOVA514_2931 [Bacteroides ovatus]
MKKRFRSRKMFEIFRFLFFSPYSFTKDYSVLFSSFIFFNF